GARAVVTDSDAAAVFACALGIPCVTVAWHTSRPEAVACGSNRIAGDDPRAVARALQVVLHNPPSWSNPYPDTIDIAALRALLADANQKSVPLELPSDTDFTGRALGAEECESAARAIRSGTLNSTKGTFVTAFERAFAAHVERTFTVACSSGSAAVHAAIAALRLSPGDEVVTTPITDMGALTCICYEGGVPVFADVDPRTMNVTATSIEAQLTARTKAIVVTHLFGLVCEMEPILLLAKARGIPVIEDCAQAFGATSRQGRAGSFGSIACYSLQQGKHMTTGEGGIVATDDPDLSRRMFLFVNKAWGYGDAAPDHYFPAPNARMTELQGAVALPQLQKLPWVVARRRRVAAAITEGLRSVNGLRLPQDPDGGAHSWWKYAFFVDSTVVTGGAVALGARMKQRSVFCAPRYVQKPAFECALFRDFREHPVTRLPLEHNERRLLPQPLFHRRDYPGAVEALESVIVLPIDELYSDSDVASICAVIREEAKGLLRG
ncbi:MAG: DegT/DnrJ/EryC1/StrS family aminotransferase, partial [Planctomycetota bacterium]